MLNLLRRLAPENSIQYREETSQRISWGHWFALFNIVVALLISSRYAFNADWPNTLFGKLYFFISLFGHFSFVVFALYLLLLFPLSFIIKNNRTFRGISVIVATIGMTILLVDTEVFKRFYLHLSPLVWDLLVNPDEGELSRQWQLLFVPMPFIVLVEMLYSRWCWNKLRSFNRQKWAKYVALFCLGCFTATHLLYAWADMTLYRPITAQKANYPLSYPMTARTFLEKHGLVDRSQLEQQIEESGRLDTFYLQYPKRSIEFKNTVNKVNIVLVNLSGLQPEAITAETMPQLYQFSQDTYRFTQHYSSGDSINSGIVGLFYGLSGRYFDAILSEKKPSVFIERLKALDYQFGLFSHNGFSEPLYRRVLFAGFKLPKSRNNDEAIAQWKQWLTKQQQPFFSYLDLSTPTGLDSTSASTQFDQQFSEIWAQLVLQGQLHKTLVIVTADLAYATMMENSFDRKRIQVPLMVYWQGDRQVYNNISSHLDLVPTVMSRFLGASSPVSDYSQGIDLTTENDRKWLLSSNYKWNVAILSEGEQYHIDRKGEYHYYNVFGQKQAETRPPLALFLQLIQQSNQFIEN